MEKFSYSYEWDGKCISGKVSGFGKIKDKFSNSFLIANFKEGKIKDYFYVESKNLAKYGRIIYLSNGNAKEIHTSISKISKGKLTKPFKFLSYNPSTYIIQGLYIKIEKPVYKQFSNEDSIFHFYGVFGKGSILNKELFFGKIEWIDTLKWENMYGYVYIDGFKYDSYGAVQFSFENNSKLQWFQYNYGKSVSHYVEMPDIYLQTILKISNNAKSKAEEVKQSIVKSLALKEQYDLLTVPSQTNKSPKKVHSISTGTGFFVSKNGYLLTNNHVIRGSYNVYVLLNGEKVKAKIIARDPANDIALLKIDKKVKPLPIETKKRMKQGEEVSVVGFPNIGLQGNEIKTTFGFINAKSGIQGDGRFCQISAPIQPGNSGSPLLHKNGKVIGIVSATLNQGAMINATGTLAQNVNYAVKIAYAMPLLMSNDVPYITKVSKTPKSKVELVEMAEPSVVLIIAE